MLKVNHLIGFGKKIATAGGGYTVTWESQGTPATGSSIAPSYPASIANGNLLTLIVGQKPQTANGGGMTTPSGWTPLGSLTGVGGYGTTLGADTGNMNIFAFIKVADGTETGTLSLTLSDSNVAWAVIDRWSKTGGTWDVAAATAEDSSIGNLSLSFTTNPGVQGGDSILVGFALPSNENLGAGFVSPAISQTGVTFGAVTEIAEYHTSAGNDVGGAAWRVAATAGTGSANPTFTANEGFSINNTRGAGIFIRIRAV